MPENRTAYRSASADEQTRCAVDVANTDDRCTGSQGLGCRRAGGGVGAGLSKVIHLTDHGLRTVRSPLTTAPTLATTFGITHLILSAAITGTITPTVRSTNVPLAVD